MKTNEIQTVWKKVDLELDRKSKDELNLLLVKKSRKAINKFLYVVASSILICTGLILFLVITTLNRRADLIYQINNITLGLITIVALGSSLRAWFKMKNSRYNQPLKSWLEETINSVSKSLHGKYNKLYLFLIPILYPLITLSIHVYFENKLFIDVLKTEESIIGLIVGTPIGLFVSYFGAKKVRKYYKKNLIILQELDNQLWNEV